MSSYTFTDPATGGQFSVQVPDGMSFEQAQSIFQQQVSTGALANFNVGQALSGVNQSLAKLKDVAVQNAVNPAEILKQIPAEIPLGSMNVEQVSATLAQTAKDVGQSLSAVSPDKGIGAYGISPQQLESAGFIKPGTVSQFLQDPSKIQSVLNNPSVWTGKKNVGGLDQLLGDAKLQAVTQNELMSGALEGLKKAGAITGKEAPAQLSSLINLGTKFSVADATAWAKGKAPADLIGQMDALAKNTQFSVNLEDKLAAAVPLAPGTALRTVDRGELDLALVDLLGDPKIPPPIFTAEEGESISGAIEGTLYSGTPDSELTYTGDDPLVWDRINGERLRRGLPGLAAIGIPRPPEDQQQQDRTIFT